MHECVERLEKKIIIIIYTLIQFGRKGFCVEREMAEEDVLLMQQAKIIKKKIKFSYSLSLIRRTNPIKETVPQNLNRICYTTTKKTVVNGKFVEIYTTLYGYLVNTITKQKKTDILLLQNSTLSGTR